MRIFVILLPLCIVFTAWLCAQPAADPDHDPRAYFPDPDSLGGWRTLTEPKDIRRITGMKKKKLDEAFNFIRTTTRNGGLMIVRNGYLVYEGYFGKGQREATPNTGSVGKSFTSIAVGILMGERPDLFPDGLDQKIFTTTYLPAKAFPLPDPRMADIKLGQLLTFSAGIRGNNPVHIGGESSTIEPAGPDGWYAMVDEYALGLEEGQINGMPFSTKTLWCEPGGGYSYASASIHIASIIVRHIAGLELEDYLDRHVAQPLGWGRWGYGYKYASRVNHTPGAGGIALRSTDMLRFGYMLLREGRWGGEQVVPKEYVQHASGKSPFNPHFSYSLQFNVNSDGEVPSLPRDAYWKTGSGGHCIYVVPSLDLVVWKLGGRDGQYTDRDTGMSEPAPLPTRIPFIDDGTDQSTTSDYIKTLEMVIAAVVEREKPATNKK